MARDLCCTPALDSRGDLGIVFYETLKAILLEVMP